VVAEGDARALRYESNRFDVVTLFTTLSSLAHDADVEQALREADRVLRPDGVLLVWEPRVPNPFNRWVTTITVGMLTRVLTSRRFETRSTTVLPPLARMLGSRTAELYPMLVRVPALRSHRLISAR
jgi:ubiquinone/menaquinone biosynthesis C-methylase UbiE